MSPRPVQTVIIAIPILLFGWLSWQFLVPTGEFRTSWEPGQRSAFIDPIRPDQRVEAHGTPLNPPLAGGNAVAIIGDPTYTFLHPHRRFDSVDVEIRFRDEGVPIVEAGALIKAGPDEVYDLQPLENDLIDRSAWKRLDENGLVLLQRTPTFATIEDFLARPPAGNRIASYRYDGPLPDGTRRLLPSLDLDKGGIDFVIARYKTPARDGDWSVATIHLDPSTLLAQSGAWKVVLSVPGASTATPLLVHRLDVTMTRPNLVETLKSLLHL